MRALLARLALVLLLPLAACGTPPTPTSGADRDQAILASPGLVRWRGFSAVGGYHYLLEYAAPAQARDARDRPGGCFWVATRRDTLVLLASWFTPINAHAVVRQDLP